MAIFNAKNITLYFGAEMLFGGVTFEVEKGDRIGLVGVNGCGKTTLFKAIRGEADYDEGEFVKSKDAVLGYMEQHVIRESSVSVYDEVLSVFEPVMKLEAELDEVNSRVEAGDTTHETLEKQMLLREKFENDGGLTYRTRAMSSLLGLGFTLQEQEKPVSVLSGGEKAKVQLAKLLLSGANLLLLDEPTNHLDIAASTWLEKFLLEYKGAYIIISHDRYFLDTVTTRTFELENKRLTAYKGSYSTYRKKKEEDLEIAWRHYENQLEEINRIKGIIEQQKRFNQERNYITIASKEKQIERLEADLIKPQTLPKKLRFNFHCTDPVTDEIMTAKNLRMSFDGETLFSGVDIDVRKHERVFLLGANGSGKTTLFKILMKQLAPETGNVTYGPGVKVGYYDQLMTGLTDSKTVMDEIWDAYPKLSQTQVRTALGSFLFGGEEVFKKVGVLSGGEKARVALLKLMLSGCNFLLLDEPTNHLDINSREALEDALSAYDGTVFIISHDRYLINKIGTRLYKLSPEGAQSINGGYDDYLSVTENASVLTPAKAKEDSAAGSANKQEYQRRKELQSDIRKLTTRVSKAEARISELEAEIADINTQMQSPDISGDYEKVAALSEKLGTLQSELDTQTDEWAAAAELLEELSGE